MGSGSKVILSSRIEGIGSFPTVCQFRTDCLTLINITKFEEIWI